MNHIQALIDGMGQQWQRERAESQMTLGKLIKRLEAMPQDSLIDGLTYAHSYRGYYSDLAFERKADKVTVSSLLTECRDAMGQVFEGYKGGDYQMGCNTPLWIAHYGCTGEKLMAIRDDGSIETAPDV